MKLSVLMPVCNELATLDLAVKKVLDADYPCEMELIIVDDGSTDRTRDPYPAITSDPRVVLELHDRNRGKDAAIRTAARIAAGDCAVMCDADLEYSPAGIPSLLAPGVAGDAKVVSGSKTFGSHNAYSYLIPADLYRKLRMRSADFGMNAEITGKLLRRGIRPYEVPISYKARSREAGKKLTWRDGVMAVLILARERLSPLRLQ